MSVVDIHLLGSPFLREQAPPIGTVDEEVRGIVRNLFDTMHADVWQILYILFAVALFALWLAWATRNARNAQA